MRVPIDELYSKKQVFVLFGGKFLCTEFQNIVEFQAKIDYLTRTGFAKNLKDLFVICFTNENTRYGDTVQVTGDGGYRADTL